MTQARIGKWGANLAVRIPFELAAATGLGKGQQVEIEIEDGDLIIRKSQARKATRDDARAAIAEILVDRRRHSLGELPIRDLIEAGCR